VLGGQSGRLSTRLIVIGPPSVRAQTNYEGKFEPQTLGSARSNETICFLRVSLV